MLVVLILAGEEQLTLPLMSTSVSGVPCGWFCKFIACEDYSCQKESNPTRDYVSDWGRGVATAEAGDLVRIER